MAQYLIISIGVILALSQYAFPSLAVKIKCRFVELGHKMKSEPTDSWVNATNFWSEAKLANKDYNDPLIRKYLRIYTAWWVLVVLFAIFILFSGNIDL